MITKNPRRERKIFIYWNKKYSVNKIHQITGYPRSTVGYYVGKFNAGKIPQYGIEDVLKYDKPNEKTEPDHEEVLTYDKPTEKTELDIEKYLKNKKKEKNEKEQEPAKSPEPSELEKLMKMVVAIDVYKKWQEIMDKKEYIDARNFLESHLVLMDFVDRWYKIKTGKEKNNI